MRTKLEIYVCEQQDVTWHLTVDMLHGLISNFIMVIEQSRYVKQKINSVHTWNVETVSKQEVCLV